MRKLKFKGLTIHFILSWMPYILSYDRLLPCGNLFFHILAKNWLKMSNWIYLGNCLLSRKWSFIFLCLIKIWSRYLRMNMVAWMCQECSTFEISTLRDFTKEALHRKEITYVIYYIRAWFIIQNIHTFYGFFFMEIRIFKVKRHRSKRYSVLLWNGTRLYKWSHEFY